MILGFLTERSWQTLQIQIRLQIEEQSDLGFHCLQYCSIFECISQWLNIFVHILKYSEQIWYIILHYRNEPKFSDRQVLAYSADPDQTACLLFPFESFWQNVMFGLLV